MTTIMDTGEYHATGGLDLINLQLIFWNYPENSSRPTLVMLPRTAEMGHGCTVSWRAPRWVQKYGLRVAEISA